jgi:hypothetical protein
MSGLIIEVFNHETEQTIELSLKEFADWFNLNDDIFSMTIKEVEHG